MPAIPKKTSQLKCLPFVKPKERYIEIISSPTQLKIPSFRAVRSRKYSFEKGHWHLVDPMQDTLANIISYLLQIGQRSGLCLSGTHRREERPAKKEPDRRWAARLSKEEGDEG